MLLMMVLFTNTFTLLYVFFSILYRLNFKGHPENKKKHNVCVIGCAFVWDEYVQKAVQEDGEAKWQKK